MKKAVKIIGIILIPIVAYLAYGFISHLLYLKSQEPGQKLWEDYLAGKDVVDYYENLYTGQIMTKHEYKKFNDSLDMLSATFKEHDSLKREMVYQTILSGLGKRNDSTILSFKYTIRVGSEYLVRENSYEKIGTQIPVKSFTTVTGEKIKLGGKQEKPTVINLWFVSCGGCIQEMPVLNAMHKKYGDKVNFVALTFDSEGDVKKFLSKKEFTYQQIAEAEDYIKAIGTQPYPETIFVDKNGHIKAIEGVVSPDDKQRIEYFESTIEKLL
ncbi:MAG: TlpA family protein disulfide reductase [Cyclobacteriaceae bacterium]|nr:TlpA family protein disulfide reductase [Cyclobacteriaceae bacterium]